MELATREYKRSIVAHGTPKRGKSISLERVMLDANPDCIKVLSPAGTVITMNRAGCIALGVPESSKFGMPWLPLLPKCVHAAGELALEEARNGHSARFPGQSLSDGETRYWDNMLTPVKDDSGAVTAILCISRDVTTQTHLERELEEALSRERLLAAEMRHRIKNVFAVVSSLVAISEREAVRNSAPETSTQMIRERIMAFARASDALVDPATTPGLEQDHVQLGLIVELVLRPYANRYQMAGDGCPISRGAVTPIILFLHELATNSIKYGAFGADGGSVALEWKSEPNGVQLTWSERNGPLVAAVPSRHGFGTDLIERIAQSAGGSVIKSWATSGLVAEQRLPTK